MNITHIAIPFDELQLFKDEEQYQNYLMETLIYSTRVCLHSNNRKTKCILVITKNTLWLEQEQHKKKKMHIPLKSITDIVKAEEHPQLVLITEETEDNLRISTPNEQRALSLISAISFYFTYLSNSRKGIRVYTIKQNSLLYFQRTVKQKKNGPKFNLQRYNKTVVSYVQSKNSPDIFGKIVIHKMVLAKQLFSQGPHLIHLAEINDNQYYLCHTIDKSQEVVEAVSYHKNVEFIQKLEYAKKLQYKVQLFFEYLPILRPRTLKLTDLFEQLYSLYDLMKKEDRKGFITPEMLLKSNDSKKLILRQFRYSFLLLQHEYNSLIYRKIYNQKTEADYICNKMYNIGLLIYYFLFGRALFEHDDLDFTIQLKSNLKAIPFPRSIHISYSKNVQLFIENCIVGKFKTIEDIRQDPWIQINKIYL